MKIAVIGSRNLKVKNLGQYLPQDVTEIVSGGVKGIDTCAREYAQNNNIKLTEFLPDYDKYGRFVALKRPFYTSKRGLTGYARKYILLMLKN